MNVPYEVPEEHLETGGGVRGSPGDATGSRILLGVDGESLILRPVLSVDESEYRCKSHYKTSPSFTYRLKLVVVGKKRSNAIN